MEITVSFKNGSSFGWKNVKARELSSVFTDIADLLEKSEAARKAFKGQSRLTEAKGKTKKCPNKEPQTSPNGPSLNGI